MKILMTSIFFYPNIGGIETVTENIAFEFTRLGHEVIIMTLSNDEVKDKTFPFLVVRKPSISIFFKLYKWCNVFVHQGISLKWIWPTFLIKKPWVIVAHQVNYQSGVLGLIKKKCFDYAYGVAVSKTTFDGYQIKNGTIINNSFDHRIFNKKNHEIRENFIFVGKLTKGKGCYLLLEAFNLFKIRTGSKSKLTFVGDSIERPNIEKYAQSLESSSDIKFLGFKYAHDISELLNNHKCQIVPSIEMEAFGVVVLEGLSCGCVLIGSDGDGISEALGDCGILFKKNNIEDLSKKIELVDNMKSNQVEIFYVKSIVRVNELSINNAALKYLELFEKLIAS